MNPNIKKLLVKKPTEEGAIGLTVEMSGITSAAREAIVSRPADQEILLSDPGVFPPAEERRYRLADGQTGTLFVRWDESALPAKGKSKRMKVTLKPEGDDLILVVE